MNINFNGKVAVITGAASGIGLACAELFADQGAKVALVDCQADRLAEATQRVKKKGAMAEGYQLDVTNVSAIFSAISRIKQELGEVDILVCSAGIVNRKPAEKITEEDWDAIFSVNAKGLFFCNQTVAIQSMIPRKAGAIVNISSISGLVGMTTRTAYCATKGAVNQITRAEAIDWAPYNIRVNAVAPTFALTDINKRAFENPEFKAYALDNCPLHRLATVNEIAAAVAFLASDEAKMVTGIIFPVDGGWTAH